MLLGEATEVVGSNMAEAVGRGRAAVLLSVKVMTLAVLAAPTAALTGAAAIAADAGSVAAIA